jgi:hypothetical protein
MGTKNSMQQKFLITSAILQQITDTKRNIDFDGCISLIMRECLCERRKARELFFALIPKFPYKETSKKRWEYIETNPTIAQIKAEKEAEEVLNA